MLPYVEHCDRDGIAAGAMSAAHWDTAGGVAS